jgi:hypothetical protein
MLMQLENCLLHFFDLFVSWFRCVVMIKDFTILTLGIVIKIFNSAN